MYQNTESFKSDKAACLNQNNKFFPKEEEGGSDAVAICKTCLIEEECLLFSLKTRQDYGVWGGMNQKERHKLFRRKDVLQSKIASLEESIKNHENYMEV